MFDVLMESRAARPRRTGSTVTSAVAHGALIAAVIWLARPGSGRAITPPLQPPIYVPVHPETRVDHRIDHRSARSGAQAGRTLPIPIFTPTELPPIEVAISVPVLADPGVSGAITDLDRNMFPCDCRPPHYPGDVVDEHLVDRGPRVLGRPPEPRYPTALREAGIQGRVVAEFVVDTLGRPELDVLKLDASQVLLAESVRAVLPRYRFTPGEANGHKVRTRVQLPFDFTLTR
ncbi:MAG: energy transducer TonB [Gemmatimonadaceae bacterium]